MKQQTLATATDQGSGFEQHRRPTRRGVFLWTMEQIVRGQRCARLSRPATPSQGKVSHPLDWERMPRMYFLQHWFNLGNEACEEALLHSTALR